MSQNSCHKLKNKLEGYKKLLILGIGSELHGDDVCGLIIADSLTKKFKKNKNIKIIKGETAPENYTGDIKAFNPTHLIIIDAADIKGEPGDIEIIDEKDITGVAFSTHTMPLKIIVDYLRKEIELKEVIIVGIKPKTVEFGFELSKEVEEAIGMLVKLLSINII